MLRTVRNKRVKLTLGSLLVLGYIAVYLAHQLWFPMNINSDKTETKRTDEPETKRTDETEAGTKRTDETETEAETKRTDETETETKRTDEPENRSDNPSMYLIDNPGCKISNIDPFNEEVMKLGNSTSKIDCLTSQSLTFVNGNILRIDEAVAKEKYNDDVTSCSYESIQGYGTAIMSSVTGNRSSSSNIQNCWMPMKFSLYVSNAIIRSMKRSPQISMQLFWKRPEWMRCLE